MCPRARGAAAAAATARRWATKSCAGAVAAEGPAGLGRRADRGSDERHEDAAGEPERAGVGGVAEGDVARQAEVVGERARRRAIAGDAAGGEGDRARAEGRVAARAGGAGRDGRAAGIGVVSGEHQRAGAVEGDRRGAAELGGDRRDARRRRGQGSERQRARGAGDGAPGDRDRGQRIIEGRQVERAARDREGAGDGVVGAEGEGAGGDGRAPGVAVRAVGERQRKAVADAAAMGRTIEPAGNRWV